ncbi:MAG: TonB C-terminal domain-containing protein [Gemmatimonadetes bacterium]|nr:TonB C-terminal domain-containing protein [Gemmatimonadota bacterium]
MSRPQYAYQERSRQGSGITVAFAGTFMLHAVVAGLVFATEGDHRVPDVPVYTVQLVAAPRPEPEARRAPEVIDRPAQRTQAVPRTPPPQTAMAEAPPPPEETENKEPAPRSTPDVEPLEDEEPSTGDDPATLSVSGVDFPFPEYLGNIVAQIYRRWQRPPGNESLRAEVLFLVRQDGTITSLRFVQRSGSFAFDLEAQGAIEAAGNTGAFGPLPEGFAGDILPVSFFFDPRTLRR